MKTLNASCSAFALSLVAITAHAQTVTDYPMTGVQLRNGWDSYRDDKTTGVCIQADDVTDPGQTTDVNYASVADTESLMTSLSISVQAKASLIGGGGSASAKFSRDTKLSNTGTNISVHVLTTYGADYLVPAGQKTLIQGRLSTLGLNGAPRGKPSPVTLNSGDIQLTPHAQSLLAHKKIRQFRLECGDSYVSATVKASGIDGVVAAETHSDEERQSITADLKASYGVMSGQVNMSQDTQHIQSENRLSIAYHLLGSTRDGTAQTIPDFAKLVSDVVSGANPAIAPKNLIEYRPYSGLVSYSDALSQGDLGEIADQYFRLFAFLRMSNDVIDHPENYILTEGATVTSVAKAASDVNADMEKLKSALDDCENGKPCRYPAGIAKTDYDYRALMPLTVADGALWASQQGERNNLQADQAALASIPPTTQIAICTVPKPWPLSGCAVGSHQNVPNPPYAALQQKIAALQQEISSFPTAFDDAEMRFRVYISRVNDIRCNDVKEPTACIDGTTLAGYRTSIQSQHT